jgi:acyl-coenzyme A thioesterase PaaI-like protein
MVHFRPGIGDPVIVPFHQLPSLAGRRFAGDWWSVDPEKLDEFDSAAYLNAMTFPWAEGTFPDGLVEGFHLLALLDYMMNAVLHLEGEDAFGWNYGLDRVRFVSTIRAGERIRLTGEIAEVRPKDGGYLVRQDCVVEVEGSERPGFVAEWWVFWLPDVPPHG